MLTESLESGRALETFRRYLAAQGGNPAVVDDRALLPQASKKIEVMLEHTGYISRIHAEEVGTCAMLLGAGRETKESQIDLAVGIMLHKKVGDLIKPNEPVATLHVNDESRVADVKARLRAAFQVSTEKPARQHLIYGVVTKDGTERFV